MKLVEMNGGLGNQISQYAFLRWLELICGHENILIDDASFYVVKFHNGFEMDKVFKNAKLKFLSQSFDKDVWVNIIVMLSTPGCKEKIPNILQANGIDTAVIADPYWYDQNGNYQLGFYWNDVDYKTNYNALIDSNSEVRQAMKKYDNIYYMGVWNNAVFYKQIKKELEHELKFPPLEHAENIAYRDDILSKDIAVGLHVRRGDFIDYNKTISPKKYAEVIKKLKFSLAREQSSKPSFYIFSDDLKWCKDNLKSLGFKDQDDVIFVEGNHVDARNYIDMQLMTFCDYLIHNIESSFCLAAAMISEKDIIRIECSPF